MFFDARAAKLLKPGEHMTIEGCPGLRLAARDTRKTWIYRYKSLDTGQMKQVAIGHWPATSVQTAALKWQTLRDQRSAGADPVKQRQNERQAKRSDPVDPQSYTVGALVQDFITGHLAVNRKEDGALSASRALQEALKANPQFEGRTAASITRSDAFDLLDAKKATPTAAAKLRSLFGAAWDYALDAGRLTGDTPNWWRVVMKGRLKSKGKVMDGKHVGQQRRVLSAAEVAQLLAWIPAMHANGRDAVVMHLWTCTRGGEILAMRKDQVGEESDGWWWTIPKVATKTARFAEAVDLRVPLIGRALDVVQRRMAAAGPAGWLFEGSEGEHYRQKDFSTYVYSLQPYSSKVKQRQSEGLVLPVTGWSPHNLRRTGRTLLASLRCPDEIGEAILGHMPAEMVATYNAYTYDAERRDWLGRLADHLEALTGLPARP